MSDNLYITATEARSGKSAITLGIMEMLLRKIKRVGFFRPIINVKPGNNELDNDIKLVSSYFNLKIPYNKMFGITLSEVETLIAAGNEAEILEGVIKKYNQLRKECDFILCEGSDFESSFSIFEFDINADISKNLGSPVLLIANAFQKTMEETLRATELALESLNGKGCQNIATIINRTKPGTEETLIRLLKEKLPMKNQLVYAIQDETFLALPTVGEIAKALGAEVLQGTDQLHRHVESFIVAAMQLRNLLKRIKHRTLIITPGDREDVIATCIAAFASNSVENIAGMLLTGGLKPDKAIWNLVTGFSRMVPVLSVKDDTFPTATKVDKIHSIISPGDEQKITRLLAIFEQNVDIRQLEKKIIITRTTVITPKMFEYELLQRAKAFKQHIILPEGKEERILRAAEKLLRRDVVDITLLGDEKSIREKIAQLELRMNSVNILSPLESRFFDDYVEKYYELRKHKGITKENAYDIMCDESFFGTMMVYKGHADGMVSGAVHSTAATIRPALEIIKTKPGFSNISSVFLMCLAEKVLVYGDCAINTDPNAEQLAEIALSSAQTAKTFGIDPVVAMLSYSTGFSGKGEDVEKVRKATKIAKKKAVIFFPELEIDGPIQYDAAVDSLVAKTKMPESKVAGNATVLIFPDLNTGNNTYKAVQRTAGAVAIGPVLQGLKYPVNDLSRGCTIPDIINTVAITAIQAQTEKQTLKGE